MTNLLEADRAGQGNGKTEPGAGFFDWSFQSDFTNEMGNIVEPDEPEATASMPMLPKFAIHGGLTLVIDHFISKITDWKLQQKIPFPTAPVSASPVPFFFVRHGTYKNRFPEHCVPPLYK